MNRTLAALVAAFVFWGCFSGKEKVSSEKGYITTPDGVRLYYHRQGGGEKIVLIPNGLYYYEEFKRFAESRTLIFYDVRNRGLSDAVSDRSKLAKGIWQDVEDLETVRKHFEVERFDLMGHSYIGLMIGLYGISYPAHVNRMVQISPAPPDASKQYPPDLAYVDSVIMEVMGKLAKLQEWDRTEDPVARCKQFWSVLAPINVYNSELASKVNWGRCDLPNERNFMQYWSEFLSPSIQNIHLAAQDLSKMKAPVLIVHGNRDRSAAYGGARDWASMWPDARLLTVSDAAHAPWIEAPEIIFPALEHFLSGKWPANSNVVRATRPPNDGSRK